MDKLIEAAREKDTDMIVLCITQLGGGRLPVEANMVRAALIEVYEEREGEEAADALMDRIGL